MDFSYWQKLRIEDGAYCRRLASGELLAVLASGPVLPGASPTAALVERVLAEEAFADPECALAALHAQVHGVRLVSATAVRWRRGSF